MLQEHFSQHEPEGGWNGGLIGSDGKGKSTDFGPSLVVVGCVVVVVVVPVVSHVVLSVQNAF